LPGSAEPEIVEYVALAAPLDPPVLLTLTVTLVCDEVASNFVLATEIVPALAAACATPFVLVRRSAVTSAAKAIARAIGDIKETFAFPRQKELAGRARDNTLRGSCVGLCDCVQLQAGGLTPFFWGRKLSQDEDAPAKKFFARVF
jgi:hypothetical protein